MLAECARLIVNALATIYCNFIGALMILFAAIFLVGGVVGIVCYEPKKEEVENE